MRILGHGGGSSSTTTTRRVHGLSPTHTPGPSVSPQTTDRPVQDVFSPVVSRATRTSPTSVTTTQPSRSLPVGSVPRVITVPRPRTSTSSVPEGASGVHDPHPSLECPNRPLPKSLSSLSSYSRHLFTSPVLLVDPGWSNDHLSPLSSLHSSPELVDGLTLSGTDPALVQCRETSSVRTRGASTQDQSRQIRVRLEVARDWR